jgi:4-hydroxybenzoate polyprenyltransferase
VAYAVGLSLVGLAVLLQMNWTAVAIGAASVLLVAAYPFMKRITWWPQAWLGLTFNWGVLVGYAAATGSVEAAMLLDAPGCDGEYGCVPWTADPVSHVSPGALLLYAAGVFWTLGYDTIYALQDLEDDALAGVKSSARRLGRRTREAVAAFFAVCIGLVFAAGAAAGLGPLFYAGAATFALHLGWQAWRLRVDDPRLALGLFKSNAGAGLILFGALALGVWRP